MKNRDLLNLYKALTTIEGRRLTIKFSYFVAKNKIALKNKLKIFESVKKPTPEFIEYDAKRAKLAYDFSDKTEDGKPKIENNNFIIIERVDEFKTEIDKIKKEYKDAIKDQEQKVKEFESVLDNEVEFGGMKIYLKDVPETIEPSILETLIQTKMIIEN